MKLSEKSLKKILSDQQIEYNNVMEEQCKEFSREVGVMFEYTNSKIEFIAEKVIAIEDRLDRVIEEQMGMNKGFDTRITALEYKTGK